MPTLILMDSSLSLLRPAKRCSDNSLENGYDNPNESFQLMDLAKWGVDWLLSHIEKVYKLEYVAVLDYASQCDLVVPFTRDIAEVRAKVKTSSENSNRIVEFLHSRSQQSTILTPLLSLLVCEE